MLDTLSNYVLGRAMAADFQFFNILKMKETNANNAQITANTLITSIVGWVMVVVMITAFFYLIMNGFKYITAGGDAGKATEARTGIINALIGIVIVALAYVIVRFAANAAGSIKVG